MLNASAGSIPASSAVYVPPTGSGGTHWYRDHELVVWQYIDDGQPERYTSLYAVFSPDIATWQVVEDGTVCVTHDEIKNWEWA